MIKKLQRKFIVIVMGSLMAVLTVLLAAINLANLYMNNLQADEMLEILTATNGEIELLLEDKGFMQRRMRIRITPETKYETRFFMVKTQQVGSEIKASLVDSSYIAAVSTDDILKYTADVLQKGNAKGYCDNYRYLVTTSGTEKTIVFLDCCRQLESMRSFFTITVLVGFVCLLAVFLLVTILSKRALKPYVANYERQKQFIVDAGHELKTPLSIISANTDVLELTTGQSEWIDSIRNQIQRLGLLIRNLLDLTKMDESNIKLTFAEFCISEAVEETTAQFGTLAATQNKEYVVDVQPQLQYNGSESSIRQLVSILVDNALKYSPEGGQIRIKLYKHGKSVVLEVFNTSDCIDRQNMNRLFDRFYRADTSRSRETGGYGIGLSVAKAIVEAHNGKITVRSDTVDTIVFTVTLTL